MTTAHTPDRSLRPVAGLVLAAGAGRRMGKAKALMVGTDGTRWLERAVATLAGSCDLVAVTLGADADAARPLVPEPAVVVDVPGWARGMGESLRAGLEAVAARAPEATAVVITLVDLPDLSAAAVERVLAAAGEDPAGALCQARYDGRHGHPVLVGRDHWAPLLAHLGAQPGGDAGARGYLRSHGALAVDCTDLGGGDDVDTPQSRA